MSVLFIYKFTLCTSHAIFTSNGKDFGSKNKMKRKRKNDNIFACSVVLNIEQTPGLRFLFQYSAQSLFENKISMGQQINFHFLFDLSRVYFSEMRTKFPLSSCATVAHNCHGKLIFTAANSKFTPYNVSSVLWRL